MRRLFVFTVLVVIVRCQVNPLCPEPPKGLAGICVFTDANCLSDAKCTGGQICCPHLCGSICKDKISNDVPVVTNEKCPALDPNIAVRCSITKDQCKGDGECGPNKKCCTGYCGRVCKIPVILKPNSCPIIPAGIAAGCLVNENPCTSDSMCGTDMKCCRGLCGNNCVKPITLEIRPGFCSKPRPSAALTGVLTCSGFDTCTHDGSCKNPTHKCCDSGCGKRCTFAAISSPPINPVHAGKCPALNPNIAVLCATINNQCSGDGECGIKQKCCPGNCGKMCKSTDTSSPPISPVKPGTCRNYRLGIRLSIRQRDFCQGDNDCKESKKCCKLPFGKRCRLPQTTNLGRCPAFNPKIGTLCATLSNQCSGDKDCGTNQKCCSGNCGKVCKSPDTSPIIKAGTCRNYRFRSRWNVIRRQRDSCQGDNNCKGSKKCCKLPWGKRCRLPVPQPTNLGQCPRVPSPLPQCLIFENGCKTNDNCTGRQICCKTACGMGCRDSTNLFQKG